MIRHEEKSYNELHNHIANEYGYDVHNNPAGRFKYHLLLKYSNKTSRVLDVGCANGIHMRLLARRCKSITGVDINDKMLELAQQVFELDQIKNATLRKTSAADLELPSSYFDLVYSFSALLLVPNLDDALSEIYRVLRVGGIALLDITGKYDLSRIYWSLYYRRHGGLRLNSFSYPEITSKISGLGFDILESHALGFADQWKYVPGLHLLKFLDRIVHDGEIYDLDYNLSNMSLFARFANRWFFVIRKTS